MPAARRKIALFNFHPAFDPPGSGGEARCYHVWRGLAKRFDVEAVTPTFPEARRETVEHAPGLRETRIPKKDVHVRWHRRLGRFSGLPECSALVVALAGAKDPEFLAAAEDAMSGADVVILENPFLPFIKPRPGQLVAYESFNVEYLLQRENGSGIGGAWATRKTRRLEQELARSCDLLFACSSEDARIFQDDLGAAPRKVFVSPNGVDLAGVPEPLADEAAKDRIAAEVFGAPDPSRLRVAFMGSRFPTNVVAARHIVEEIAPATPEADFYIAGRCVEELPPAEALPPNVKRVGWLDDRAPFLRMAHVAINSVSGGSGTNVKMLDFLGAGLPVVSSPSGARGLELASGVNALVLERGEMPEALRGLARSPEWRQRLGRAGRAHVEKRFQWSVIAEEMADTLEHRLAPKRALTLVDYPIFPANHGGKIRVLEQARAMAASGWAATILSLNKDSVSGSRLLAPGVVETTIARDPAHNALDERLQRDAGGICVDDLTCFTEAGRLKSYRREAEELAHAHQAAILSHPYLAMVAESLRDKGHALPFLHDAHNFEFALKKTLLEESPLAANVSDAFRERLLSDFERCEREALRGSDAFAATSPEDLENLSGHYGIDRGKGFVAPNGARVRDAEPVTAEVRAETRRRAHIPEGALIAGFLGSAHLPNADAAAFMVEELAPRLPQACFFLIGGVSDTVAHLNAPANVRLFSAVDDERKDALLALCDIALNPVDQGSGTNLKLLEFLARRLPVIATSVGARGIDAEDGRDLVIAERPGMADAIAELAASPERREQLADNGRALAERLYDWSITQRAVVDWLDSLETMKA